MKQVGDLRIGISLEAKGSLTTITIKATSTKGSMLTLTKANYQRLLSAVTYCLTRRP
jgi:hypothetical protein